jgi:hypothetical protein
MWHVVQCRALYVQARFCSPQLRDAHDRPAIEAAPGLRKGEFPTGWEAILVDPLDVRDRVIDT